MLTGLRNYFSRSCTYTRVMPADEHIIGWNILSDVQKSLPKRFFDIQTTAHPQSGLPKKIFIIN
jgi:hypothetical protein